MQTHILILGAGRSATDFIDYILQAAPSHEWRVTVADYNLPLAQRKVQGQDHATAEAFDVHNHAQVDEMVSKATAVASFMPPQFHPIVAEACLKHGAHLITASYVSPEMEALDAQAKAKGLLFLNEVGADPGIDHMGAMQEIDEIHAKGGVIQAFRSYAGALVAPQCNTNPWGYKFTWAPMNVVTAGQGGAARYIRDNQLRYLPSHRLFSVLDDVEVGGGYGTLEAYANRDSLPYREKYGLTGIPTLIRGTLRVPGYCAAWNILVQLGLTDNRYKIPGSENLTYRQWVACYLPQRFADDPEAGICSYFSLPHDGEIMHKLRWLDLFSDRPITCENASPANILLDLLLEKWAFEPTDIDLFVMSDIFQYTLDGKLYQRKSILSVEGLDQDHTAISRTVGLPSGIAMKLLLTGKLTARGVRIPVKQDVYEPILAELSTIGIAFERTDTDISG